MFGILKNETTTKLFVVILYDDKKQIMNISIIFDNIKSSEYHKGVRKNLNSNDIKRV
jgi:hypothetical protein